MHTDRQTDRQTRRQTCSSMRYHAGEVTTAAASATTSTYISYIYIWSGEALSSIDEYSSLSFPLLAQAVSLLSAAAAAVELVFIWIRGCCLLGE